MGSIKLTPFVLFLILLLVLVVAMIFGYKSNMIVEGNTSSSATWSSSQSNTYAKYSPSEIDVIYETTDESTQIMFDPVTKNIIVPTETGYDQYTRDSDGTVSQVTVGENPTSAPTATTSKSDHPAPWSVALNDLNILYSPAGTATVVIIIKPAMADNEKDQILAIFRNDGNSSQTVTLSSPATGITEDTISPNDYKTPSDNEFKKIIINGDETQVLNIANGVYWSKTLGICVQTGPSAHDTSTDYETGLSKQVTDQNVLVITTMLDNSTILVNVITRSSTASSTANTPKYQLSSIYFDSSVMNNNITTFF